MNTETKYSPENKRPVPKPLQNSFYDKIEEMINKYQNGGGIWCMFGIKNLMIQAMAHGYYMEYDANEKEKEDKANLLEQNKELLEALKSILDSYKADFNNITGAPLNNTESVLQAKAAIQKATT